MVAVRQPEHVAGNWQRAARGLGQSISPLPGRPGRHRATLMSFVLVTATLRRPQAHQVNIQMLPGTRLAYTEPRASSESGRTWSAGTSPAIRRPAVTEPVRSRPAWVLTWLRPWTPPQARAAARDPRSCSRPAPLERPFPAAPKGPAPRTSLAGS